MAPREFSSLPLYDAVLRSVEVDWKKKACRFALVAFAEPGADARPYVLEFNGATLLSMPHKEPWGPSSSLNSASEDAGRFRIEMQSGDVIELAATDFTFTAL